MIPLTFIDRGEKVTVIRVCGNEPITRHLADLGIVPGRVITLSGVNNGNFIVKVMDATVALSFDVARKIYV